MRDFFLDTSKVELRIHYFVSSFHQRSRKWPRFQQAEQSNPSTVCCLDDGLSDSEYIKSFDILPDSE